VYKRQTQYRSAIFPQDDAQFLCAKAYIQQLTEANVFLAPIVTTLESQQVFYPAESYHHAYADRYPDQPYIQSVSRAKVEKLQDFFADRLKDSQDN
jgi:peptide methionine sulfoxide reductase MsrA